MWKNSRSPKVKQWFFHNSLIQIYYEICCCIRHPFIAIQTTLQSPPSGTWLSMRILQPRSILLQIDCVFIAFSWAKSTRMICWISTSYSTVWMCVKCYWAMPNYAPSQTERLSIQLRNRVDCQRHSGYAIVPSLRVAFIRKLFRQQDYVVNGAAWHHSLRSDTGV